MKLLKREETCLSWDDTPEFCELLGLTPVPVLYGGVFDYDYYSYIYKKEHNGDPCED
jgi:hypothetical protein